MSAHVTHDESLESLLGTLRRSLELICQRPPVRVQRAYAQTVDGMQDALGQVEYLAEVIAQAGDGLVTPTPHEFVRWSTILKKIVTELDGVTDTINRPDERTSARQL